MWVKVFKHKNWYYYPWSYFTWTLKSTKKSCRDEMKENFAYDWYEVPAQDTPRIISKTYDCIKGFLDTYLTEWRRLEIISSQDYCERLYSARCTLRIVNITWSTIASSDNYFSYDVRRKLCLEFFNDIKPLNPTYDKFYDIHYKEIYEWKNQWFNIEEIKEKYKNIEPAEAANTKTEETEPTKSEDDLMDLPF